MQRTLAIFGIILGVLIMSACTHATAPLGSTSSENHSAIKNIVLVHGAWADGSGWRGVHDELVRDGYNVSIVQHPLTSYKEDVAAVRRVLSLQDGPCVLVAHSYGGAVITEAGTHENVAGLVYVAAHMPDAGESEAMTAKKFPSALSSSGAIRKTVDGYLYLDPARFREYFAADLSEAEASFNAHSQVFINADNFGAIITTAAWRTKPTWMIVAGSDKTINPELERWYADRAKSDTTELAGASHSVFISRAREVASVIKKAAITLGNANAAR